MENGVENAGAISARDAEAALLARCVVVAQAQEKSVQDQREANVFRLAGMVVQSRFPDQSRCLTQASNAYFSEHPDDLLPAADVVRRGWIANLPRLRDMLCHELSKG